MFAQWKTNNAPKNITILKSDSGIGTNRFIYITPKVNKRSDYFLIKFRYNDIKTTDRLSFILRAEAELSVYSYVNRLESNSVQKKRSKFRR